jgi:pimeloyl-ACP methyl ester carboxylesterase
MEPRHGYRAEMAKAGLRLSAPSVEVDDVLVAGATIRYARYGSGRPVLVLHGSGGGWDQGVDWAERRLAPDASAGYDVISPSRFGYPGSSLPAGADVPAQATVLVGLLDALGLGQVDVVGLSAGSVAAAQLAADHQNRVRRLILESPLVPLAGRAPLPPLPAVKLLARAQYALWLTTRLPPVVKLAAGAARKDLSEVDSAELAAINATMFPLRPRRAGTVFDRAVTADHMLRDRLPLERIAAPTLIVNAAHAMLAPHDDVVRFAGRLPHAELVELGTGGHVLIGNVTRLRDAVTAFLAMEEHA